ncbi:pre-mRNA-splicing factor SLU7-like isoform X2 [Tachypleus tridentatus]|uniref:pre-mRNA-splicing factor SLU7-like isoform X2 n=1 Tax=Tachypleus tridentatus TaxID=6853 RepID=UPI003FD5C86E
MPGTKVDSKQRITVRNLRIREDIAKYLRNLDPNSAYYDPKTRSMRDNPHKGTKKDPEELQYAGDNFVRFTGDTLQQAKEQLFAWQGYEKGIDIHLQAEPTKTALLNKEYELKKEELKDKQKGTILDKYGGAQHLCAPPKELCFAQSEEYVEYSRRGQVIKGGKKRTIQSRYEEDVYINNHTSVWGSYWKDGHWGYKCCHALIKNSYCTGESGKEANCMNSEERIVHENIHKPEDDETKIAQSVTVENSDATTPFQWKKKILEAKKKKRKAKKEHKDKMKKISKSSSSSDSSDDEDRRKAKKLKRALKKEEKQQREAKKLLSMDERDRPYNSMYNVKAVTEEEMEAYFMKRLPPEDPMAAFLGN